MRHPTETRLYWADQICINQDDEEEKSQQIEIMADVYTRAQNVLIWLGIGTDETDLAMETFPSILEELQEIDHTKEPFGGLQKEMLRYRSSQLGGINRLLCRPWFNRVWTLQEGACAKNGIILCGTKSMSLDTLIEFIKGCRHDRIGHWTQMLEAVVWMHPQDLSTRNFGRHIDTIIKLKHEQSFIADRSHLFRLFIRLRSCGASDDRDFIYSIFRYLPREIQQTIRNKAKYGDYAVEELYQAVARVDLCHYKDALLLSGAGLSQQTLRLPSWVPDWTHRHVCKLFAVLNVMSLDKQGRCLYQASRDTVGDFSLADSDEVLQTHGKILGSVVDVAQQFDIQMTAPLDLADLAKHLFPCLQHCQSQYEKSVQFAKHHLDLFDDNDSITQARLTLVGSLKGDGGGMTSGNVERISSVEEVTSMYEAFEQFQAALSVLVSIPDDEPVTAESQQRYGQILDGMNVQVVSQMIGCMKDACQGRKLFAMQLFHTSHHERKRCIGLAPADARAGDQVAVVFGSPVPYVVRPVTETLEKPTGTKKDSLRHEHFALVGEAFVHGFMDGEAIDLEEVPATHFQFV